MLAWLLYCAAPAPEQARTGRLLAGLLLIIIALATVTAVISALIMPPSASTVVDLLGAALFLSLYWINRRGGASLSAAGTILLVMGIIGIFAIQPESGVLALGLLPATLILPVALAGMLLTWRMVPLVTAVAITEMLWLYNAASPAGYSQTPASDLTNAQFIVVTMLVAIGAVATFSRYQIEGSLDQLGWQNTALRARSARERGLLDQMRETSTRISQSASEIAAAAGQQAGSTSAQAEAITEVTDTVEELNHTAQQIAIAAASVASAAELALRSAQDGQEAVRESIAGMARINGRINDIVDRNLALAGQSQRISEILDVISTISAQTHILALNAAVESAGAGEYGQRFAVVAAEVKKLAQRSVHATKEVQTVVSQIQEAVASAVMATEEGLKEGDHGVQLAHQSGEANEAIISLVEHTAQLANAISLATQQQRTASEQVVTTMHEVAAVTRQAAATSRQTQEAVDELHRTAQGLGRLAIEDPPGPARSLPAAPAPPPPAPTPSFVSAAA